MQLDGIYTGGNVNTPSGIRATGTPEEFKRVGPLPARDERRYSVREVTPGITQSSESQRFQQVDIPADKPLVQQIAKATEIHCTDQRLIDWMAQG